MGLSPFSLHMHSNNVSQHLYELLIVALLEPWFAQAPRFEAHEAVGQATEEAKPYILNPKL